jgi:hypothetical protein
MNIAWWHRLSAPTAPSPGEVIAYLREHEIILTWNPAAPASQAHAPETAKTATVETS